MLTLILSDAARTTKPGPRSAMIAIKRATLFLIVALWSIPAHGLEPAATIDGVRFALVYPDAPTPLHLRGVATLRYLRFIKAYAGALYMSRATPSNAVLDDVPKHLVLEYFQAIEAEDFAEATRAMVERNTDADTFSRIAPELYRLCRAFRSVAPTDRYALTYTPESGLALTLNGILLGTFQGPDFARAMFAVWLGDAPIDKAFRKRLLGAK
ncbi:chalcone isomerase family protein [Desulfoluna butyratoxydans]|uniref:Chalcone isomerase n=1 Tax=Desulfoluna butyratoxydans TaxID=231438 RepID=A0A4U8YHT1_9BACT|nr:chalcone isomerase family protein [Desulfoluna butyratoxydans]VFQ42744.1 chalcone isomerase [Desulfoluna butyratoxydans]